MTLMTSSNSVERHFPEFSLYRLPSTSILEPEDEKRAKYVS